MKRLLFSAIFCLCFSSAIVAQDKQGAYLGAQTSETPHWFKESFLEFEEDVAEAAANNKRLMIYFSQEGCPYCAKLVEENFANPATEAFVRKHFDGITINMWGDREIVSVGGQSFTEKSFAEALKVQYTPTLLFLNEQGQTILRLNGYYPPEKFSKALQYAGLKHEKQSSFNEFMLSDQKGSGGQLIAEDFFEKSQNLKGLLQQSDKPLALYFESTECADCKTMHERILTDMPTRALAESMHSVQLDVNSDSKLVTPDGREISQQAYAKELNIGYTPSVILLDAKGQVVHRIDGFLKTFHFQSSLAYVLEQGYIEQPSFQRYLSSRGEKLREQGFDTNIWGYSSAYPAKASE